MLLNRLIDSMAAVCFTGSKHFLFELVRILFGRIEAVIFSHAAQASLLLNIWVEVVFHICRNALKLGG